MQESHETDLTHQRETVIDILVKGIVRYFTESNKTDSPFNSADSLEDGLSSSRTDRSL